MERDSYIDFLRSIGLILVILAHVSAPNFLAQLRNFDVPLMVFVSGLSYSGKQINGNGWFLQRMGRLIIPVYFFLTLFFLLNHLVGRGYPCDKIAYTFLMCVKGSIGYIWIIKVFLFMMLLTPLLININNNLNRVQKWIIIGLLFLLQEVSSVLLNNSIMIVSESVPYVFGYAALFLAGLELKTSHRIIIATVSLTSLLLFIIVHWLFYRFYMVNDLSPFYKYPPRLNYLLYGLSMCSIFWFLKPWGSKLSNFALFRFLGQSTIWIYLWHIPLVMVMLNLSSNWMIRYLVVLGGATFIYYVQFVIVNKLQVKRPSWSFLKYFKG